MKYDYPGGIRAQDMPLIERFEADVLPYTLSHGPWIGEAAMKGDFDAEEIIRRQRMFVEGLPSLRAFNYEALVHALKRWEAKGVQ